VTLGRLSDILARHASDPIAASLEQPGLELRFVDEGVLGLQRAGSFAVSLGAPVGTIEARTELWKQLLAERRPLATYLTDAEAAEARRVDGALQVVPFGVDYLVTLQADAPREAASAAKKARKKGFTLESASSGRDELEALSRRYLERTQAKVELRFLNRPALLDTRSIHRFVMRRHGALMGFVEVDLAPADPSQKMLNVVRFEPSSVWGLYHWVVFELRERLLAEGLRELSLGFVPLAQATPPTASGTASRPVLWQFERLRRARRHVYGLESLEAMKALWPHRTVPRFVAFRTWNVLAGAGALCEAMGVTWWKLALRRTWGR